jgi:hypothetical protein
MVVASPAALWLAVALWLAPAPTWAERAASQPPTDVLVQKWTPDLSRGTALDFVRDRLQTELGAPRLLRHAAQAARQQLGRDLAAKHLRLSRAVDLTRALPGATPVTVQAVQQILARVEGRPASGWLAALRRETRAQPDRSVRRALVLVCNALIAEALPAGVSLRDELRRQDTAFRERLAARLLWNSDRALSAQSLAAAGLPELPPTADAQLASLLARARDAGPTAQQYLYLERQAANLRGSSEGQEQQLGQRLGDYLARFKRPWSDRWLQQRATRFTASRPAVAWDLLSNAELSPTMTPAQQAKMERRLRRAWRLITGLVHPALLQRLPPVSVRVALDGYAVPGIVDRGGKKVITLLADSSVKDILHELGHELEYYGGLGVYAAAHKIRARRGNGRAPLPLQQLIPNTSYAASVTGFQGGYLEPYIGRYYGDGYTEVISMGLERFAQRRRARQAFAEDGSYMLALLEALQRPPAIGAAR